MSIVASSEGLVPYIAILSQECAISVHIILFIVPHKKQSVGKFNKPLERRGTMHVNYPREMNSLLYDDVEQTSTGELSNSNDETSPRRLETQNGLDSPLRIFLTSHLSQLPDTLLSLILPQQICKSFC